jgi:hypothetical protein
MRASTSLEQISWIFEVVRDLVDLLLFGVVLSGNRTSGFANGVWDSIRVGQASGLLSEMHEYMRTSFGVAERI